LHIEPISVAEILPVSTYAATGELATHIARFARIVHGLCNHGWNSA